MMNSGVETVSQGEASFKVTIDKKKVAVVIFEMPNSRVNTFSPQRLAELEEIIDALAEEKELSALFFLSGKRENFIAGADLNIFSEAFEQRALFEEFIRSGHRLFDKVAALPYPTVAVIDGACLGGGLEFALACSYRIASDHSKTVLGLPEVTIGLVPGWGGTQRLPRLIGLASALPMILKGKAISAAKAYQLHLVDQLFVSEFRQEAIESFLEKILQGKGALITARRSQRGWKKLLLERFPGGNKLLFSLAKRELLKRPYRYYTAPHFGLELLKKSASVSLKKGLEIEIDSLINCGEKALAQAPRLISNFFTSEKLKREKWGIASDIEPKLISTAAVVGGGTMGSGIAWLLANHNIPVRLKDLAWQQLAKGIHTVDQLVKKGLANQKFTLADSELFFQNIAPALDYSGFKQVEIAIEAVSEELPLKKNLFVELEEALSSEAILATNTSSLTIASLSQGLNHPERFIGLHFFNPVHKMPLVEVIPGAATSSEVIATAVALCRKLGKMPIVVGDCTAFLVNRIFMAGANAVMAMLQEGVSIEQIDRVVIDFGMPMSPFALFDEIGIDVCYKVALDCQAAYGPRMTPPSLLAGIYEKKFYGKKSSVGFYRYHNGKRQAFNREVGEMLDSDGISASDALGDDVILRRFLLPMIEEARRCLDEKVVSSPEYLQMALCLGIGYPPYRPGLLDSDNSFAL